VGKDFDSAWLPFGMGPRGCLGIPLALAILKMAFVAIVGKFQLFSTEENVSNERKGAKKEEEIRKCHLHINLKDEPNLVGKDVLWPKTVRIHVKCR
jgi:hypothetical protein